MAVERRQAERTSFIIARENESTGSPVTDRTQAVQRRYVITAWNHDEDSEKQSSDALRAGRADVFGEDGYLWGSGNVEIEIPSESGFLDIIQGVLADPNPVSVKIPDKTLVPKKTNLSDVIADNYFTNAADITVKAVDEADLADKTVNVVDGQNLSGAGAKTIVDNLSGYAEALTLTVTPNGSAMLTDDNTPGTIVITYTDAAGQPGTLSLSFVNASKTDPQTTELPAGGTITEVTTTGWKAGTFKITTLVVTKEIANGLSGYSRALTLTVTPNGSAVLTDDNTPGTIVITYTDAAGQPGTLSLSFVNASKTDPQTTELPAGGTITEVTTTGWKAGKFSITIPPIAANLARNPEPDRPGRLRVKYTGALTDHTLLIRGVRRVGLASNDTLPLREEIALGSDVLSEKHFHKISKVIIKDANGAVVATSGLTGNHKVEMIAEPGGYETTLKTVNDEFPGWTLEPEVGGEPWLVTRGVPIGAEIEVGESIGATIDILSNRVDKRRTIEGGDEEQFIPTAVQHPDEFPFVGRRFFSGYGRFLQIDGEAVICDSAPISIAHNYDFAQGKIPGRFRRSTEPTARRNVTSSVQTKYESGTSEEDVFVRWDEKFRNNESVSVRIVTYQWLGNGRQLAIIYDLPNCEITSPVRVPVTGPGSIDVNIELKAVPLDGATDGELVVTIISDDQWMG